MPVGGLAGSEGHHPLARRVRVTRGCIAYCMSCEPAFDYARATHRTTLTQQCARFISQHQSLGLAPTIALRPMKRRIEAHYVLEGGQAVSFVLQVVHPEDNDPCAPSDVEIGELFEHTVQFWNRCLGACTYEDRWREMVSRAALTLKLLTF